MWVRQSRCISVKGLRVNYEVRLLFGVYKGNDSKLKLNALREQISSVAFVGSVIRYINKQTRFSWNHAHLQCAKLWCCRFYLLNNMILLSWFSIFFAKIFLNLKFKISWKYTNLLLLLTNIETHKITRLIWLNLNQHLLLYGATALRTELPLSSPQKLRIVWKLYSLHCIDLFWCGFWI